MRQYSVGSIFVLFLLNGCAPDVFVRVPCEPQVQVLTSQAKIQPGHAVRIKARTDAAGMQISGWDQTAVLAHVPGTADEMEAFLAVPLKAKPGPMDLLITFPGAGNRSPLKVPITVLPRPPDATVRLRIKNFARLPYTPESRTLAKVRAGAGNYPGPRPEPWEWPVRGRISERFGVKRIYNNGLGSWPHGGYDISAPGGTPVLAPADGRVIFAVRFQAHGNTILIDHGYGVITTYLHLRAICVKAGEEVKRGQAIGEVGSTGGSTADHLHFQVNVNGLAVEPEDFLSGRAPGEMAPDTK